jgi:hypothetical protein
MPSCLAQRQRCLEVYMNYRSLAPLGGYQLIGKNGACFTTISLDSVSAICTAFSRP